MRPATLHHHRVRIDRLAYHLRNHLDEPLDLSVMAREAGFSPRQLERVFARVTGETPRGFLRRLRIERAAVRLRFTKGSILTIGVEAGFESHEAFTRAFRQRFGQTPAAYRGLTSANLQPRDRAQRWQLALAGGLRRYLETV